MPLPITAYLGLSPDPRIVEAIADHEVPCPGCSTKGHVRDGTARVFLYGEEPVVACFVECGGCGDTVLGTFSGDEDGRRTLSNRLAVESAAGFDAAALPPMPGEGMAFDPDEPGAMRRLSCPECDQPIPVIGDDFPDARRFYPEVEHRAGLFNGECPHCGEQVYSVVGSPDGIRELKALLRDEHL